MAKHKLFALLFAFIVAIANMTGCTARSNNLTDDQRSQNSNFYDNLIAAYLGGQDVSATILASGDVKIPLAEGGYILIPESNSFVDKKYNDCMSKVKETTSDLVKYEGEIIKPSRCISNVVTAPKTGSVRHDFNTDSSFSCCLSGSSGVDIEAFEVELDTTFEQMYPISGSYSYTVPANRFGAAYVSELYDKYTYKKEGWLFNSQAVLLVPTRYLLYYVIN